MRHSVQLRIGPAAFRIGSDWTAPVDALADLYRDYPMPDVPDVTISRGGLDCPVATLRRTSSKNDGAAKGATLGTRNARSKVAHIGSMSCEMSNTITPLVEATAA